MSHVSIRVDPEIKQNLLILSRSLGYRSMSDLIRRILEILSEVSRIRDEIMVRTEVVKKILEILEKLLPNNVSIILREEESNKEIREYILEKKGKVKYIKMVNYEKVEMDKDTFVQELLRSCYYDIDMVLDNILKGLRELP